MDPTQNATTGFQQPRKKTKFNTRLYKTELCRSWTELGYCPYGSDRCQFAHGMEELRPVIRHKKYKTVKCKNFLAGYCPYGARCCFIHDEPTSVDLMPQLRSYGESQHYGQQMPARSLDGMQDRCYPVDPMLNVPPSLPPTRLTATQWFNQMGGNGATGQPEHPTQASFQQPAVAFSQTQMMPNSFVPKSLVAAVADTTNAS